jgi:succinoglycan biosynthesis protein ExoA
MRRGGTRHPGAGRPLVSVIVPMKDEADHLPAALRALQRQTYPAAAIEIVVVDGGSQDRSCEIVRRAAESDPRIRLLGGPGVNCPAAMNLGIEASGGELIAKIDGHGYVDPEFIERAVDRLCADPRVGCVGGLIDPISTGPVSRANSIARFSVLGVGAGAYTTSRKVQEVDTVQCGIYRRETLDAAGGFDDDLQFGEDEELNYRVRGAGYTIVFDPEMRFSYQVRPTLASLWRQYRNYGRARVRVVRKHPRFLRPKHTVPLALVCGLGAAAVAPLASPRLRSLSALAAGGYAAVVLGGGLALSARERYSRPWLVSASLATLHLGYGVGSLQGIVDGLRRG